MELFPPAISLALAALAIWTGLRQGERLRARGFTPRQQLHWRDLPGASALIPLVILVVPPLLLLRNYPQWYWYFPLEVQLRASGIIWTLVLCSFFHIAGIIGGLVRPRGRFQALSATFALLILASGAEYGVRLSPFLQPPKLGPARVSDGVILQTTDSTCAAASLANVATHLDMPHTEADMAALMGTTAFGTDIAQVYGGLRRLGLRGNAVLVQDRDYHALHSPAILFVDYGNEPLGHAICYMGEKDGRAEIWNPQGGKSFQTQQQLAGSWRGHAMEVLR